MAIRKSVSGLLRGVRKSVVKIWSRTWARASFVRWLRFRTAQTRMFWIFRLDDLNCSWEDFLYQILMFSNHLQWEGSPGLEEKSTKKTVLSRNRKASHQEETVETGHWSEGVWIILTVMMWTPSSRYILEAVLLWSLASSSSPPWPPLCSMMSSHPRSLAHLDGDPPALPPVCWYSIPRFMSEIQSQLDDHPSHGWEKHWRVFGRRAGHLCPGIPE